MAFEFLIEFWNVYSSSVIEYGVQTLQHALLSKIHLIDQEPVTLFDCSEENTIAPPELDIFIIVLDVAIFCSDGWILATEEVHHVCLLAQVHPGELSAADLGQIFNETGLSNSWRTFDQDWLLQLIRSQQSMKIRLRCLCIEGKLGLQGAPFLLQYEWPYSDHLVCVDELVIESI